MKKLLILSIMISLFAFWGSKNEVNIVKAEEVVPVSETSATFFEHSNKRYLTGASSELHEYRFNIVSLKLLNNKSVEPTTYLERIMIQDCTYTDASGVTTTPEEGIIFAYLSETADSTESNKLYDCVLYANVDKIYANKNSTHMFAYFTELRTIDISILDTSRVTNMSYMFSGCMALKSLESIKNFDTSNVENMKYMFGDCDALSTLDLSNFDTSKVTDMSFMFRNCLSLTSLDSIISTEEIDTTKFVTTNVTNMSNMFQGCDSLTSIDLSQFDTTNVTNMNGMFSSCSSLTELNLSSFKTSNVTDMAWMFSTCTSLTKIDFGSNFDTSNVTIVEYMFHFCQSLTELDLSSFDLTKTDMRSNADGFAFLDNCTGLRVLKLPPLDKILDNPDPNTTLNLIHLPRQLQNFYGFYNITSDNADMYSVLKWSEDTNKFVSDWRNLRAAGEAEGAGKGICAALVKDSALYSTLTGLLETYDAFDEDSRKYIDIAIDKDDVTIGESIRYVKNVLNGTQTANVNYVFSNEDSGSYMTISLKEESPYLIAMISLIGILSVLGYYFYSKKKQTM